MNYAERKIRAVSVSGVQMFTDVATGNVHIELEGAGADERGPQIALSVTIVADEDQTMKEINDRLLAAAASLLTRASAATASELREIQDRWEIEQSSPLEINLFPS